MNAMTLDPIFYFVIAGAILMGILKVLLRISSNKGIARIRGENPAHWQAAADEFGLSMTGDTLEDLKVEGILDGYEVLLTSRVETKQYRNRQGLTRTYGVDHFDHQVRLNHPRWATAEGLLKHTKQPMLYDDPRPGITDDFLKTFEFRGEQAEVTDAIYADPTIQQALLEEAQGGQFSLINGLLFKKRKKLYSSSEEIGARLQDLIALARRLDEAMERVAGTDDFQDANQSLSEAVSDSRW